MSTARGEGNAGKPWRGVALNEIIKKSAALKDKASSKKQHTGRGRGSCDCVVIKLELHWATNALWQQHSFYIYSVRLAEVNLGDVGYGTAFHLLRYECGAVADAVDRFFFHKLDLLECLLLSIYF